MKIEELSEQNLEELTKLFLELWPESDFDEEYAYCKNIIPSKKETCFLMKDDHVYIAFIYLACRFEYVEGSTTTPLAYIEGIYVKPQYRKSGLANELVELGEKWGKKMGCKQYASDTEIENEQSIAFHKKVGFKEANRIVCFLKDIK